MSIYRISSPSRTTAMFSTSTLPCPLARDETASFMARKCPGSTKHVPSKDLPMCCSSSHSVTNASNFSLRGFATLDGALTCNRICALSMSKCSFNCFITSSAWLLADFPGTTAKCSVSRIALSTMVTVTGRLVFLSTHLLAAKLATSANLASRAELRSLSDTCTSPFCRISSTHAWTSVVPNAFCKSAVLAATPFETLVNTVLSICSTSSKSFSVPARYAATLFL
mmetsp:Transcript_32479/g.79494  ORF Transcript_32479/g.79494 Transcript_32479/m.79494 type:complete len:225 (+) Transcript_32479:531-1205(+)